MTGKGPPLYITYNITLTLYTENVLIRREVGGSKTAKTLLHTIKMVPCQSLKESFSFGISFNKIQLEPVCCKKRQK